MKLLPICRSAAVLGCAGLLLSLASSATGAPPEAREVQEAPLLQGPAGQPELPIKRPRGAIGTLILVHSESGREPGGQFVRITGTALPGKAGQPAELAYDKFLGPLTLKSLDAIIQPIVVLHHGWPRGQKLELSFSDKPTPVELNAASLANVLLLDSMLRDYDIDQNFAVVGAIQADGTLAKVGSIPERLIGAARSRVARIVVPDKNADEVADYLLAQGINAFVGTQIFTAATFNDAGVLASSAPEGEVKEAITLFGSFQRTLPALGANGVGFLRSPQVQATLQNILNKAPNLLSAKVLLEWGSGKHAFMSFDGSVSAIERFGSDLIRALRAKPEDALKTPARSIAGNLAGLRYIHDRLDARVRGYDEALLKFGDVLQRGVGNSSVPPKRLAGPLQQQFDAARVQGNAEWTKMATARLEATPEKP